tara:strand:- start:129122 stop:129676 length:555 start_codon:yes stop_codon:yes gene_type:complete
MSIQILGGNAKGLKLSTPQNLIRPTSVLLKRRLFDSIQDFSNYEFVDLCAGSGAIGLEAASRGASSVYLNEMNGKVFQVLKSNVQDFQKRCETKEIKTSKMSFDKFLKSYQIQDNSFLFFDPPYEKQDLYLQFLDIIKSINAPIKVAVEFCRQKTMPCEKMEEYFGKPERSYQQGTSFLYIYDL